MSKIAKLVAGKSLGATRAYGKYTYESILLAAKVLYGLVVVLGLLGAAGMALDAWTGGSGGEPVAMGPPAPPPAAPDYGVRPLFEFEFEDDEPVEVVRFGDALTVGEMGAVLSDGFGALAEATIDHAAALGGFGLGPVVASVQEGLELEASRQAVRRWRARAAVREIAEIETAGPIGRLRRAGASF